MRGPLHCPWILGNVLEEIMEETDRGVSCERESYDIRGGAIPDTGIVKIYGITDVGFHLDRLT